MQDRNDTQSLSAREQSSAGNVVVFLLLVAMAVAAGVFFGTHPPAKNAWSAFSDAPRTSADAPGRQSFLVPGTDIAETFKEDAQGNLLSYRAESESQQMAFELVPSADQPNKCVASLTPLQFKDFEAITTLLDVSKGSDIQAIDMVRAKNGQMGVTFSIKGNPYVMQDGPEGFKFTPTVPPTNTATRFLKIFEDNTSAAQQKQKQ